MVENKAVNSEYNGPVVVICGPTGSGKTGLAISIAKKIGGEVISADSRAIYKYMDIGTAKPTIEEMEGIPHFGLDLVEPGERFTVADWKEYTEKKISEIRKRGHVPIVAGGTGLYIDSLVYNYHFSKDGKVEQKSYSKITGVDEEFAEKYPDRVAMENGYLVYGIKWETEELRNRLMMRERILYCDQLFDETRFLVEKYGWDSQAMKSNIYQFAWQYMNGELSLEDAIEQNFYDDWHLAKRQITWFKRNKNINWLPLQELEQRIITDLNEHNN